EPSIAVSPAQTSNLLISAFGNPPSSNPFFTSANGGAGWDHLAIHNYPYVASTVAWSPSGQAYAATLVAGAMPSVVAGSSANPQIDMPANAFMPIANSTYMNGPLNPDQPHLIVTNVGGNDRLYVGINDLNRGMAPLVPSGTGDGKTALVWLSLNPG